MITFFAFLVFSSSHEERRYNIPQYISASTAITAVYCMTDAINFHIISKLAPSLQPGKPQQSTGGAAKVGLTA